MNSLANHSPAKQIVVVDAVLDDYRCLATMVQSHTIRMALATTGAGGLRLAPSHPDALWLVSVTLPDMSGLDLLEMIRATQPRLSVFAVDGDYDAARERRALQLSATRYVCKPVQPEWIADWQGPTGKKPRASSWRTSSNTLE